VKNVARGVYPFQHSTAGVDEKKASRNVLMLFGVLLTLIAASSTVTKSMFR
jgi:hypothetical protein